jgi:ubiquinone/menaquinone biosynthesis C-methylase UbiE
MAPSEESVATHYSHGDLLSAIKAKLAEAGLQLDQITVSDLTPFDHLHGRGAEATRDVMANLQPSPAQHLIDIGCGIGGPARLMASETGCDVLGIDLTPEFVSVAEALSEVSGSGHQTRFQVANALELPFEANFFDGGYTQNVSMSVPDKVRFFTEAFRVLKSGARFIAGEVTQGPGGAVRYPVPWAMTSDLSFMTTAEETQTQIEAAGFRIEAVHDQTEISLAHNEAMRQRIKRDGPPVLSPLIVLGDRALERSRNAARNLEERRALPVEFVCVKP